MRYAKSAKALIVLGATLAAIPGLSLAATSGSSTAGIDAGNTAGIDAGNILGIDAGNTAGIDAGNILGIDAGNTAGIDAGNILGIDAGNTAGIDAGNILGIDAGNTAGIDAGNILLAGPVDSIDRVNGVFASMGQVVMASQGMLDTLRLGDFVTVQGSVISSGWYYADAVNASAQRYVPGSTEVFVSGMLSSIDQMNGTARMGDLTIDYTPSLGRDFAPSGEMWAFRGTRPSLDGAMISDRSGRR